MITTSNITHLSYEDTDCVYIVNPRQAYCYLNNSAVLYDIFCGRDYRLVFVFNKNETKELKRLWDEHKLS